MKRLTLPEIQLMLRLHLLRHAEPLVFGSFSSDKERTLSDHGKTQCKMLKEKLSLDWSNLTVWCSTAQRTKETIDNIIDLSYIDDVEFKEELYHATLSKLIAMISSYQNTKELMIIGHNNGITDFLNYLTGNSIVMQTGHYVCLEFPVDHWIDASLSVANVVQELVP